MIDGHFEADRYVPEPSVTRFEELLGALIAARPCGGCSKPIGQTTAVQIKYRRYHAACVPKDKG